MLVERRKVLLDNICQLGYLDRFVVEEGLPFRDYTISVTATKSCKPQVSTHVRLVSGASPSSP